MAAAGGDSWSSSPELASGCSGAVKYAEEEGERYEEGEGADVGGEKYTLSGLDAVSRVSVLDSGRKGFAAGSSFGSGWAAMAVGGGCARCWSVCCCFSCGSCQLGASGLLNLSSQFLSRNNTLFLSKAERVLAMRDSGTVVGRKGDRG